MFSGTGSSGRASSSFQPGDEPREDTPGFCFGDVTQVLVQKDASVHREWILVSHTHRGASWASGAAQAAQFVRIILRFWVILGLRGGLTRLEKPDFFFRPASPMYLDCTKIIHQSTFWIAFHIFLIAGRPYSYRRVTKISPCGSHLSPWTSGADIAVLGRRAAAALLALRLRPDGKTRVAHDAQHCH